MAHPKLLKLSSLEEAPKAVAEECDYEIWRSFPIYHGEILYLVLQNKAWETISDSTSCMEPGMVPELSEQSDT